MLINEHIVKEKIINSVKELLIIYTFYGSIKSDDIPEILSDLDCELKDILNDNNK